VEASRLGTAVDPLSDAFARNAEAQRCLVDELDTRLAAAALGGPEMPC